jgi:hypothetical protein
LVETSIQNLSLLIVHYFPLSTLFVFIRSLIDGATHPSISR